MSENSILTPSSDFYMDLIFSSWSMINKGNNLYVSMCVMGPLKGLSQITPGPRTASKNGYFGHFRTVPVRLPSDSTGAWTILRTRTGAGVSKTLLPILPAFYSNR